MSGAVVHRDPPLTIWIMFCTVCGRDDRYQAFTGKSHFTRDGRCSGTPVRVVYKVKA